jgi:hypothetical protein
MRWTMFRVKKSFFLLFISFFISNLRCDDGRTPLTKHDEHSVNQLSVEEELNALRSKIGILVDFINQNEEALDIGGVAKFALVFNASTFVLAAVMSIRQNADGTPYYSNIVFIPLLLARNGLCFLLNLLLLEHVDARIGVFRRYRAVMNLIKSGDLSLDGTDFKQMFDFYPHHEWFVYYMNPIMKLLEQKRERRDRSLV